MLTRRALVLDDAAPIDRRIDAALAMARDPDGGLLLIQLAAENKIAYQLREAIGSVIFSNPDRSVRTAAAGSVPAPGRRAAHDRRRRDCTAAGDAARGQARFAGAAVRRVTVIGTAPARDVGPDLTDISKKFDLAGLVEAIVNPNAAIAFGFGAELFVTRRNEPHIGFLQADGPTVSIRDGYGRVRTLRTRGDRRARAVENEPDAGSAGAGAERTGCGRHRGVSDEGRDERDPQRQ